MQKIEEVHYYRPRDRIVEQIECYIIENGLKPGDKLPSERNLCQMWECNHMTLRAALKRLAVEGRIRAEHGSGNFVAGEKLERYLQDFYSFSDFVKSLGKSIENRIISLGEIECNKKLSQKLCIPLGKKVLELVRLRVVDSVPVSIESAYLPLSRFEGLGRFDFENESLYSVLEREYGINMLGGEEEIGITNATALEASLLGIGEGNPVFLIKQVSWDENKIPVEYVKTIARPDKMRFASVLKK